MTAQDQWNEWVEPFDVFISYARKDNEAEPNMVSAFVEKLEADFQRFSPALPLKVFFDKKSILDGQYWQAVLRKGLRQSKVMVAFLSPAYFTSEWCRKEWEEYILVEQNRTYPGEALTPIFIVAPADLSKIIPPAAQDWWQNVTSRNAVVEIVPFWNKGREALQEAVVVRRMERLAQGILERVEHGRVLAKVPRDVRGRNPNFVGRHKELTALRDLLSRHDMVGICAVNGVGGIGKSSIAREYAYLFRQEYLGGQFEIDLSSAKTIEDVESALVRIARSYLNASIPETLPESEQYARAKGTFNTLPPGERVLLLLDNLNEDATTIVGRKNRDRFPSLEKVHILVTTRAEPRSLGGLDTVSLDILPPGEALDLLFRYRAFARQMDDPGYLAARAGNYQLADYDDMPADAEWKSALAVVVRLGRHSLALALVGAYLGSYPDISYHDFAANLATHGIGLALDAAGHDERVQNLIAHPAMLIGPLFEQSVARLTPLALRTLEYAAILPADLVPVAWLKQLVTNDPEMASELRPEPFRPPPWDETLRTLGGLDYLKGAPYARMHRVVQEVIRCRRSEEERQEREEQVIAFIEKRARDLHDGGATWEDVTEVDVVEQFTRSQANRPHQLVGRTAISIVGTLHDLGRLRVAREMALLAEKMLNQFAAADPTSAQKQRDLSISFNRLGEVSVASGDLPSARRWFEEGLRIREQLAQADPTSAQKQRDLSSSFNKLGDVSLASGDLPSARRWFEEGLRIREQLAQADPTSAQKQRDLWVSHWRLGDILEKGDDSEARCHWQRAHDRLADMVASGLHVSPQDRKYFDRLRKKLGE